MNCTRTDGWLRCLLRLGAGSVVAGVLVVAPPAPAYRLIHDGFVPGGEAGAQRWPEDAWPLRYRLLENQLLPEALFADHDAWREFLGAAIQQWNEVATADVDIRLEEEPLQQAYNLVSDGLNTIGFTTAFSGRWAGAAGFVSWVFEAGSLEECDVNLDPNYFTKLPEETPRDRLTEGRPPRSRALSGLLPLRPGADRHRVARSGPRRLFPDPTMSYGDRGPVLTRDDIVGVSLLYPASEFRGSTGSVSGAVRFRDGSPARYA